jgi:putative FmdB family regulatory protein
MPAYDYQCAKCHHTFEVSHKVGEHGPKSCPQCKGKNVEKVFLSPPAFHTYYSPLHPRRNRGRGY